MPIKLFSVPSQFVALVRWLNLRLGLDLRGRINFTRGFSAYDINITKEDILALKELTKKNAPPRNKHPSEKDVSAS